MERLIEIKVSFDSDRDRALNDTRYWARWRCRVTKDWCGRPARDGVLAGAATARAVRHRGETHGERRSMSPADSAAVTVQDDLKTLTRTAADLVVEAASRAWDREFRVALSGGSTPQAV